MTWRRCPRGEGGFVLGPGKRCRKKKIKKKNRLKRLARVECREGENGSQNKKKNNDRQKDARFRRVERFETSSSSAAAAPIYYYYGRQRRRGNITKIEATATRKSPAPLVSGFIFVASARRTVFFPSPPRSVIPPTPTTLLSSPTRPSTATSLRRLATGPHRPTAASTPPHDAADVYTHTHTNRPTVEEEAAAPDISIILGEFFFFFFG